MGESRLLSYNGCRHMDAFPCSMYITLYMYTFKCQCLLIALVAYSPTPSPTCTRVRLCECVCVCMCPFLLEANLGNRNSTRQHCPETPQLYKLTQQVTDLHQSRTGCAYKHGTYDISLTKQEGVDTDNPCTNKPWR